VNGTEQVGQQSFVNIVLTFSGTVRDRNGLKEIARLEMSGVLGQSVELINAVSAFTRQGSEVQILSRLPVRSKS
jgi:hypothetical protein